MSKSYKTGEIYTVAPESVLIREEFRGRRKPLTEATIRSLAESMCELNSDGQPVGQMQPVRGRITADGQIECIFGFTRHAAVSLAIAEKMPNAPEGLRIEIVAASDADAALMNVSENKDRSETNAIDDAYNIKRLQGYGISNTAIAKRMRVSGALVSLRLRLLKLSEAHQQLVIDGLLNATPAQTLAQVKSAAKRDEIVAAATNPDGSIDSEAMMELIRNLSAPTPTEDDGDSGEGGGDGEGEGGDGEATQPNPSRSIKQVKAYFTEWSEAADVPICVRQFYAKVVKFISGGLTEATLNKNFDKLIHANLTEDAQNNLEATEADESDAE